MWFVLIIPMGWRTLLSLYPFFSYQTHPSLLPKHPPIWYNIMRCNLTNRKGCTIIMKSLMDRLWVFLVAGFSLTIIERKLLKMIKKYHTMSPRDIYYELNPPGEYIIQHKQISAMCDRLIYLGLIYKNTFHEPCGREETVPINTFYHPVEW